MRRGDNHARCRHDCAPSLQVMGVLPTVFDGRTKHSRAVLDTIAATYDIEVVTPPIPLSIRFAEAPAVVDPSSGPAGRRQAHRHIAEGLHSAADRLRMESTR